MAPSQTMLSIAVKETRSKADVFGKDDDPLGSCSSHSLPNKVSDKQVRRALINVGGTSLRDKFAKFKDASFRLTRHNSGLKLVDGVPVEFDTHRRTEDKINRPRKKVQINLDANDTRLYELSDVPQIEQWWSSDELNTSRCDGKLCAAVEPAAQEYCRAFERAYRQVHTDRKLTAAYLTELVKGLDMGHRGLEQYSASNKRKTMIREHVMSVIKCYRDKSCASSSCSNSMGGLDDSSHASVNSGRSGRSGSTASTAQVVSSSSSSSLERTVRNHSAKLSAGNRHFAAAMGKAERLAAHAAGANGGTPAAA